VAPEEHGANPSAYTWSIDQWFESVGIRPEIIGEFEDSAFLMVFGFRGAGLFPAASVIAKEVERQYQVRPVGRTSDVRERRDT
jgi:LysR family transcriptional regulator, transcriptional activator of nhaA